MGVFSPVTTVGSTPICFARFTVSFGDSSIESNGSGGSAGRMRDADHRVLC